MPTRQARNPHRSRVWWCLLVVIVAAFSLQPSAGAALSISDPQLHIGKVDPGHTATFERSVANTGDAVVDVQIQLSCPCDPHLTVTPTSFLLAPGEARTLTMTLDVPLDAEPGVHDVRVKVIERAATSTGGTGQSAIDIVASYQIRTVGLYADPAIDPQNISARVVNAFTEGVDIEVTGTLATDPPRAIDTIIFHATGSEAGSRVTRFHVDVPLEDSDRDGVYTLHLQASWHNETAGITPGSRSLDVPIGWGVPTPGTDDPAPSTDEGNGDGATSGQPNGPEDDARDDDGLGIRVSGTWLLVGAALAGGVLAGVWLGRRRG